MSPSTGHLIAPHGGELVDLLASPEKAAELKAHSREWPSWDLTARQICDLELLLSGGFSPLRGFMNKADYEGVCHKMRLASGVLWPMPITLDVERRVCQEAHTWEQQSRAARRRGRDAGRVARGRGVAARPQGRSQSSVRHNEPGSSRRRLHDEQIASVVRRRAAGGFAGAFALRFSHAAIHARGTAG